MKKILLFALVIIAFMVCSVVLLGWISAQNTIINILGIIALIVICYITAKTLLKILKGNNKNNDKTLF